MEVGAGTPEATHRMRGSTALAFLQCEPVAVEGPGFSCSACMEMDHYLHNWGVVHKACWEKPCVVGE